MSKDMLSYFGYSNVNVFDRKSAILKLLKHNTILFKQLSYTEEIANKYQFVAK